MLLQGFDTDKKAVIEPGMIFSAVPDFPETVVSVFSHELFYSLTTSLGAKIITQTNDVDGVWPIFQVVYRGKRFGFCKARLGAPACVGLFEDVIAMGAKRIILVGNCGVLDRSITDCGLIIPLQAIRDEGTSYHYCPASDTIPVNRKYTDTFLSLLQKAGYSYRTGTTWTTDAFFRETPGKVQRRKEMGAVCVEMECAAMQAMCDFRGTEFFQYLYAGDNLDNDCWEPRSLSGTVKLDQKEKIVLLAFELAYEIEKENEKC